GCAGATGSARFQGSARLPRVRICRGRGNSSRTLFEVVFLCVIPERPEAHPEELGGFHLDPSGAAKRLSNVFALDILNVALEVESGVREWLGRRSGGDFGRSLAQLFRQAVGKDGRGSFQGNGALH